MAADPRYTTVCTFTTSVKGGRNSNRRTTEQAAHELAGHVADCFSAEDVAVDLADAGGGRWKVAIHFGDTVKKSAVRAAVAAAVGAKSANALRFDRVHATDWVRQSLEGLTPVAAGRFMVHGAHDRADIPLNRVGIEVEAALAFGTGHHGTTRGCLLALDRICKSRRRRAPRILDLGTGSGVLAIAAALSLRGRALGTDIDVSAVQVARGNARINRVGPWIEIVQADGVNARSIRRRAPFDLAFANILLGPLQRVAAPLRRLIAPGGRLVLSGLLASQANAAIAAYRPLRLERRINLEGWTTLVLVRPPRRLQLNEVCS
jgi:ribosomal protein L11 methyltransferase